MATSTAQKTEFLSLVSELASQFCQLEDLASNLSNAWYLRTYVANGAIAITDTDAAAINCTAAQLQNAINFMGALSALKAGTAVISSNQYDVFLENARTLKHTRWWSEADRT